MSRVTPSPSRSELHGYGHPLSHHPLICPALTASLISRQLPDADFDGLGSNMFVIRVVTSDVPFKGI